MDWKIMLAYISGSVVEELLLQNEYLVAENRLINRARDVGQRCLPVHRVSSHEVTGPGARSSISTTRWPFTAGRRRSSSVKRIFLPRSL